MNHARRRIVLGISWLVLVASALGLFLFRRVEIQRQLQDATSWSAIGGGAVYLLLGCLRGFTLIPSTSLVILAVPFFPPATLFELTLAGILVSSASIYWFSESLHLDELVHDRHKGRVLRLRSLLERHELPVIIAWSFFPLAPTDLICYVCGFLRVNVVKCLVGVAIGEGAICGIYIFFGDSFLRWLGLKL